MRKALSRFAAVVVLTAGSLPLAAGGSLPYRLAVAVDWGPSVGPEALREELETELIRGLVVAACFESVVAAPGADKADLTLRLQVSDYREETEYEYAVSQIGAPDLDTDRLSIAHVEATFLAEVIELQQGSVVRSRSFRQRAEWRPTWHEDPREHARRQLVEEVLRAARKLVCKGSATKWSKELERARRRDGAATQR
jgi:hypothetical protein